MSSKTVTVESVTLPMHVEGMRWKGDNLDELRAWLKSLPEPLNHVVVYAGDNNKDTLLMSTHNQFAAQVTKGGWLVATPGGVMVMSDAMWLWTTGQQTEQSVVTVGDTA